MIHKCECEILINILSSAQLAVSFRNAELLTTLKREKKYQISTKNTKKNCDSTSSE